MWGNSTFRNYESAVSLSQKEWIPCGLVLVAVQQLQVLQGCLAQTLIWSPFLPFTQFLLSSSRSFPCQFYRRDSWARVKLSWSSISLPGLIRICLNFSPAPPWICLKMLLFLDTRNPCAFYCCSWLSVWGHDAADLSSLSPCQDGKFNDGARLDNSLLTWKERPDWTWLLRSSWAILCKLSLYNSTLKS